jgi:hypothetical protein
LMDELANVAVVRGSGEAALPSFQMAKALTSFRRGAFQEAIDWATRARDGSNGYGRGESCALLAMAQWKAGSKEAARLALAESKVLIPRIDFVPDAENAGFDWMSWLFGRLSVDEAQAMIDFDAP